MSGYALTIQLFEKCPRCGMPPGIMCVYTKGYSIHRDPVSGKYVYNQIGKPMLRTHYERNRNMTGEPGKYNHQPDFGSAVIVSRPENADPDKAPLLISAPCVCNDETHHWTATVYAGSWSANRHVPETADDKFLAAVESKRAGFG